MTIIVLTVEFFKGFPFVSMIPRTCVWNSLKIKLLRRVTFPVWSIATISEFPIQSLLYYFTRVRYLCGAAIAGSIHGHFILLQNKQAFNHSFSLQLLSLQVQCPAFTRFALPRQNQYPALNIFPRVRNCLLRMASGLRNTRTPHCARRKRIKLAT